MRCYLTKNGYIKALKLWTQLKTNWAANSRPDRLANCLRQLNLKHRHRHGCFEVVIEIVDSLSLFFLWRVYLKFTKSRVITVLTSNYHYRTKYSGMVAPQPSPWILKSVDWPQVVVSLCCNSQMTKWPNSEYWPSNHWSTLSKQKHLDYVLWVHHSSVHLESM